MFGEEDCLFGIVIEMFFEKLKILLGFKYRERQCSRG